MKLFQNLALIVAGLVASVVVINSNQSAQAAGITLTEETSNSPYEFDLNIPADTSFGPNSTVDIFYQGSEATLDASLTSSDFDLAGTNTVDIGGNTYYDAVFSTSSDLTTGSSPAFYTLALDSSSFTYEGEIITAINLSSPGQPTITSSGTVPVPEPGAIGGSAIALGLGAWLKRKKALSV